MLSRAEKYSVIIIYSYYDLKDKYDRLELDYVEMRSSLNKELLEHKAIIKYLEGKLK